MIRLRMRVTAWNMSQAASVPECTPGGLRQPEVLQAVVEGATALR